MKRTTRESFDSSAYPRELFEVLSMGVVVYRATDDKNDFIFVDINPAVEMTDSVKREEIIGRRLTDVFPGVKEFGLFDVLQKVYRSGITEKLPPAEYRDERIRGWRSNRVYRLPSGYVVAVYEDVTLAMEAELALQASEARYKLLTESSLDGIWDWNLGANSLYLSPRWKAQLGYEDQELTNEFDTWANRLHPDDIERVMNHLDAFLVDPSPIWEEEFRLQHKAGHYVWVLARGAAVFNEENQVIRILGVHIDIDRRKRDEDIKSLNKDRLEATLALNQEAQWVSEKEIVQTALEAAVKLTSSKVGYLHFVNSDQESIELVTWTQDTLRMCEAAFDSHYPLSQAGIWADCVRTRRPMVHNDYKNHRNRKGLPEGHIDLIRHMSIPVIDLGQVKLVIGVGNKQEAYTETDVEQVQFLVSDLWKLIAKKRTEEKLKQAAAVYESTQEAVTITDTTPRIIAVNRAFTEITGYSEEEVTGSNPSVLKSGRHDEDFYRNMWNELTNDGHWQGEIWNRRKSGEIYPEWLNISAIYDESGLTTHYVAVFSDISILKQSEDQLERMAHYDPLTGLPNRILLFSRIEHAVQRAARNRTRLAVLFLDLDNFKNVNDSLGHPAGDRLLKKLADRFKNRLREEDTIARIGGDEFVVLIEDVSDESRIADVAQAVIQEVTQPITLDNHELSIGGSVGISLYPQNGKSVTDLIKNADAAMYLAKDSGRNSYQFYTPQLTQKARQRLQIESDLRQAVKTKEILPYYQPVVRVTDGSIIGAEALARWLRNGKEYYSPGRFIPIAEDSGLIEEISNAMLDKVCEELSSWRLSKDNKFKMAFNLSSRQFQSVTLVDEIAHSLQRHQLSGENFEFELTETVLMKNPEKTARQLERLKALGASIAIDDFGTGFSSLAYLTRFPIDKLKIDRSFVMQIHDTADKQEIVSTIHAMAKNLDMLVTAEGVETATQLMILRNLGCDLYQGYFFSRPISGQAFCSMLQTCENIDT
ncbi:MAG: EAL domain-containing protein [Candidatus Thiodiazotropha sp. (ex Notomyrtea botanica)]|nr:EAL domain-containing protein [Candidatus Thiodiazotropha sp. (ex Notomyrtea botanica)]